MFLRFFFGGGGRGEGTLCMAYVKRANKIRRNLIKIGSCAILRWFNSLDRFSGYF